MTVAKSGLKIKESPTSSAQGDELPITFDKNGLPVLPAGRPNMLSMMVAGHIHIVAREETMGVLAETLRNQLRAPLYDETALLGQYDFVLDFSPDEQPPPTGNLDSPDPAPNLFSALTRQLGLTLKLRKGKVSVIVIDHVNAVPMDN